MKNEANANTNPIEAAVMPLKTDAMDRAEQYAQQTIKEVAEHLAASGNDLRIAAPYPKSNVSRAEYMARYATYKLYQNLTTWRNSSMGMNDPCPADMDAAKCLEFVSEARKDAAFQYDAFVAKLVKKIGACSAATLEGNHVWSFSILRVTVSNGENGEGKENWKTTMILNRSKLGKVFNQFPTRKVKK